jgi:acyl-CoA thioester hydrolase
MLGRLDPDPLFFAPFVSSIMPVEDAWIDYNGHLNMAYYNVLFDRAVDQVYALLGVGAGYMQARAMTLFTAEAHTRYLRELHRGDGVRVTFQLLDFDAKRLHYFEHLHHATEGFLSATCEVMSLHVDLAAKKTAPFPEDVAHRLGLMRAAHARLPRPEGAGRRIAMPEKA